MHELCETIIAGRPSSAVAGGGVMDSHGAVIARTGFFVLCSVFKERRVEKAGPELDALGADP